MFNPGVVAALVAALLFGASAPIAKWLLQDASPWVLAGLFYLGSGIGLTLYRLVTHAQPVTLQPGEAGWLAGAVLTGGVAGPVLLMFGLTGMPASGAALLLNAEGVLTAVIAWVVFKENFDRRIALGMLAIAGGAVILSWPGEARFAGAWPALAILGACLCWAIDNNLTRKVAPGRCNLDCYRERHCCWQCESCARVCLGKSLTRLANNRISDDGRVVSLRREPRPVCGGYAPSGNSAYRRLFFGGPFLWGDSGTGYRRAGHAYARGSRKPNDAGHLASSNRAT